jgi:hypothetical protein
LGIGADSYKELMFKGEWVYKNSKGELKSVFDTKWGRNKTPENLGNVKNFSKNARAGIRATKIVKVLKTGGKIIIVVGVASDVYNVFMAYKNNDPNADAVLANAGVNTAMVGVGFIPGVGWGISAIYFTIGATIGWENAIPSYIETEKAKSDMRQQKITNFSDFKNSP